MKKTLAKFALLLLTQIPVCAIAGGEDEAKIEPEYLSQDQVTQEDYITMAEFGGAYDECLTNTSRAEVANYDDPRHVVDVAMKQCAVKLEDLNDWLTKSKFPPGFKKGYIRKISGSSVRQVMPEIMYMMSIKQQ
ncbi:MAG: hypothetical protein KAI15_00940 [Gammaproteobacteria bacterium]|nr:hypothetical protein [Gammaproteobacteria bacterium]MCK5667620.1 hypothetical protein [Gammaproteobacteria bacterium]